MSAAQPLLLDTRKRSRPDGGEDEATLNLPNKRRQKESSTQARREARERFWNTLSKIWLTPRALREFDRRNSARVREQGTGRLEKILHYTNPYVDTSQLPIVVLKSLKRFARRGGPSLQDLRNVSDPVVQCQHIH